MIDMQRSQNGPSKQENPKNSLASHNTLQRSVQELNITGNFCSVGGVTGVAPSRLVLDHHKTGYAFWVPLRPIACCRISASTGGGFC